jgi:hypothetical protein
VSELMRHFFLGISPPNPASITVEGSALAEYEGRYHQTIARIEVTSDDDALVVSETPALFRAANMLEAEPARAIPIASDRFAITEGERRGETIEFLRGPAAEIDWMRWDGRISRRITT